MPLETNIQKSNQFFEKCSCMTFFQNSCSFKYILANCKLASLSFFFFIFIFLLCIAFHLAVLLLFWLIKYFENKMRLIGKIQSGEISCKNKQINKLTPVLLCETKYFFPHAIAYNEYSAFHCWMHCMAECINVSVECINSQK